MATKKPAKTVTLLTCNSMVLKVNGKEERFDKGVPRLVTDSALLEKCERQGKIFNIRDAVRTPVPEEPAAPPAPTKPEPTKLSDVDPGAADTTAATKEDASDDQADETPKSKAKSSSKAK